ncbi:CoA-binding protein [Dankookia rubra]|uniref:CoA-binding protein n=1 Tax=Dankookia rubra TaxID=1442381 RepID=A0A4R5QM96_9PROT|nr:acetate--CoA ligase family protein [Dankookia rubra]TDH63941.1 CoA-binding protein [Dankookia rubra]
MHPLHRALFQPRRIALIGASADRTRLTARAQLYLRKHGYAGEILPVHARENEVLGVRAYPTVTDIPGEVDFAYILLNTPHVEGVIEAVAAKGIGAAGVLADGFAEAGPNGAALQARLVATAQRAGLRILGPNSMGMVNLNDRIACTVNAALEAETLPAGRIALVSQSGSMMGAIMSRGAARGIGFSHIIGTGNEADLSAGEIGGLLVDDPQVDAILLFLEAIRQPQHYADLARRAHAAGKPVIAYKLGRSPYGAELATSHTGALAGSDAAAEAFFKALGILRVTSLESMIELPALVIGRKPPGRSQRAVSVTTTTGGGGAMAVDCLGVAGIEARAPDAAAAAKLDAAGIHHHGRLLDLTLAGAKPERVAAAIDALQAAEDTDLVLSVIGSSAQFKPQDAVAGILRARDAGGAKPIAAFLVPQADASLRLLAEAGIPAFRTPEVAADCIRAWSEWRAPRPGTAFPVIDQAFPAAPDEADARRLFAALGLASAFAVLRTPQDAAKDVAFPVALKILSPDLAHKTEVGGVKLGIADAGALRQEAAAMQGRVARMAPAAKLTGFLVQPMAKGLGEAIIGFRRDPEVGPVVLLGTGGITAELFRDVTLRLAPVDEAEARTMIAEVKGMRLLGGWRGLPRGDLQALARAVVAVSRLAARSDISEAEINPLIIHAESEGVTVADAWVVRAHNG